VRASIVAIAASMLYWSSAPVNAQAAAAAAAGLAHAAGAAATAPAPAVATTTTSTAVVVPITGTVSGLPESVSFAGVAQLSANVVTDPDFGAVPTVLLSVDLGKITGIGSSTGKRYTTSTQENLSRRLAVADTVQFNFPFSDSAGNALSPRVGKVSINLNFNVGTMKLTGATAAVASP